MKRWWLLVWKFNAIGDPGLISSRFWQPLLAVGSLVLLITWAAREFDLSEPGGEVGHEVAVRAPAHGLSELPRSQDPETDLRAAQAPAATAGETPDRRRSLESDVTPTGQADDEAVMDIGDFMDPDDPSTWVQANDGGVLDIGRYMDPDDPGTWQSDEGTGVLNIGANMDPDDNTTWPVNARPEGLNVGEYLDPERSLTWPNQNDARVMNVGEYRNPDDPSIWSQ